MKFIVLFSIFTLAAWPQNTNQGTVVGSVLDPSGAVVPNAAVAIRNLDTGLSRSTQATAANYRLDALPPGNYEASAEAAGFKRTVIKPIKVEVGQIQRVDFRLDVGQVSDSVTVSATTAPVNTESPALGEVIENTVVQQLPLNGREFLELGALLPGVEAGNVKRGVVSSYGVAVGFGGARAQYNSYYVDGADSTDANQNQLISSPSLDAIREFRIETNMYSAQYGRSGGAVVSVVTKSGTNKLHGSLFEYHRNRALDALPHFYTGPRASSPRYLFNQFGATAGGPVRHNKTFFLASYEGYRAVEPGQQTVSFAPTAKERVGDLTQTINPYTNKPAVLRNPFDGTLIPGNILPASLFNKVGKTLMDLWPSPNASGDPFLNYKVFRGATGNRTKYLGKIDHLLTAKDTLTGTFNFGDYNDITPGMNVYGDTNNLSHDRTASAGWTRLISNRIVNDLKFSYTRFNAGSNLSLIDKNYATEWGIWNESKDNGSPRVLIYTAGSRTFFFGGPEANIRYNNNTYLKDLLTITAGKHALSLGADFKFQKYDWNYAAAGNGGSFWLGLNDGGSVPISGSTFSDVLMAVPTQIAINQNDGVPSYLRRYMFGAFAQDDWKVSRNLTLNLGLRYDYEAPWWEALGRLATFDFSTAKIQYAAGAPSALLDKLTFPFERNGPNHAYNSNPLSFAPRAGFAWRPFGNNKTAIRGGYGMFYTSESAYSTAYASWIGPFSGTYTYAGRAASIKESKDHYVTMDQKPYNLDVLRFTSPGSFFTNDPYYPQAYMQQWNFTLSRQLAFGLALETSYVGSKGTNLSGVGSLPVANTPAYLKVSSGSGLSPTVRLKGFNSKYNSWQTKLVKRYSNGMHLIAAYTLAHSLAESSNEQSVENIFTDTDAIGNFTSRRYANADTDVRQRLSVTAGYQLPFGNGRKYGAGAPMLAKALLADWDIQGIFTAQGGYPFTVYDSSLRFTDRTCDGNLPADQRTAERWYNPSCFPTHTGTVVVRADGSKATTGVNGNAGPDVIRGPGTMNLNIALHKEVRFHEGKALQLRFESFNVANRTNLQAPAANYFINTPTGGAITRAGDMRQIQMAAKIVF